MPHGRERPIPLHHLRWTELARLAAAPHADPVRRRQAERFLSRGVDELTLGERVSLARRAVGDVIEALARSEDAGVLIALLGNGRLLEALAVEIAASPRTPASVLAHLAENARWSRRRSIRLAVVGNPTAPPQVALGLLRRLAPEDVRGIGRDASAPRIVQVGARRLLQRIARRRRDGRDANRDRP